MPYQIDDVSDEQIKFGYWLITHKEKFKKVLIVILFIWCVISVGYGIFGFVKHYLAQNQLNFELAKITTQQIDFSSYRERHKSLPLRFIEPAVVYTGSNKYDIVAWVTNPNGEWFVEEFTYQFQSESFLSPTATVSILPGEEKRLISLSNISSRRITDLKIVIINDKWQRINANKEFPQVDFSTSEVDFKSLDDKSRSWISFQATNNSINNFWEVEWQTLLYSGSQVVGVNYTVTEEFLSGQTREVVMSWFENLPRVTKVEVFPVVNFLDPNIIFKSPGQAQELY